MPTYTYKCPKCKKQGDLLLEMGHEIPFCDNCDNVKLDRIYTAPGVVWKCGGRTETTSATKEKNQKLKKLWNDSKVGNKPNPKIDNLDV